MAKFKISYAKEKSRTGSMVVKFGMVALAVALICVLMPKQPRFRYEFQKGAAWNHDNLVSPYNFAILKTQEELARDREQILKAVLPIYRLNAGVDREQIYRFETDIAEKWQLADMDERSDRDPETYRAVGKALLGHIYHRGIMSLNNRYQNKGNDPEKVDETQRQYNFTLLHENIAQQKNTVDVFTIASADEYVRRSLARNSRIDQKQWLGDVLKNYITINYIFDEDLTTKAEQNALANISTTRGVVQKGELIAEKDKIVSDETFRKLESLRKVYEDETRIGGHRNYVFCGQFVMIALCVSLLMVFLQFFRPSIYYNNRLVFIIMAVVVAMLGVLSWAIGMKIPSLYYIPYCSVPIIFRVLFDTRVALNIHLLMVLIAALFVPNSYEFVFLQFVAGMVAIYSIKTLTKREQFLMSSTLILATYILAYIGLVLARNGSLSSIYWTDIVPFVASVGLTLLSYPLIYAFERLFGIVSDLTLMELTNSNSQLLRELSFKAPGTFQHSLQVANLAEAAIYKIGGNPLLVRAGALYHDIGKMSNPLFFIENQKTGSNPHEALTREQSAQVIISHVHKGVEAAKKHQLPEVLIDFIRTHHGTTRVDYFYNLYRRENPDKPVDEAVFRYPGPVPFSKETAVLMIADSVEAASRAMKEPTEVAINKLVDKIVEHKIAQRQFVHSDITMRDITEVSDILKSMLKSIYHVRIDYKMASP